MVEIKNQFTDSLNKLPIKGMFMVAFASSAARTKLSIASFFVELSSLDCTNNRNVKTISFEYTKNEFYLMKTLPTLKILPNRLTRRHIGYVFRRIRLRSVISEN